MSAMTTTSCRWPARNTRDRPAGARASARPDRQPHPHHPRRPELQPGVALGRRAQPGRRDGHAQAPGGDHAGAAMGARGRRLQRTPVRREAPADARRAQCRRAGHAGVHPAPVRPRPAQRRRAARVRLRQGHAQPARRRDRARRVRATPPACCWPSPTPRSSTPPWQGAEAAVRVPAQLHPPLHARAQPARRHRRHRCRRRLAELPR